MPVIETLNAEPILFDTKLTEINNQNQVNIIQDIGNKNAKFFDDELEKLDKWSDDKRNSLKITLRELDDEIKELKKQSRLSQSLPDKLSMRKKLKEREQKRDEAWRAYDVEGRVIEEQKDKLIDDVEAKLNQQVEKKELFTINWKLV